MDLLHSLKNSTSQYHQQIEQIESLKKIITNEITLLEYKKLLCQLYGFINPCEKAIPPRFHYVIEGREKSLLLNSDLSELNCDTSIDFLFCRSFPNLNTLPEVFGYLYVLEGSTLGGQIITKLLKKNVQLLPAIPTRYFNAYGKQTRKYWDAFLKSLIDQDFNDIQKENLVTSAIDTFSNLYNWLNSDLDEVSYGLKN